MTRVLPFSDAPASRPFLHLDDGSTRSYGQLAEHAARFAHALAALGVQEGDRVAVQVEKSVAALALYLGCVQAGFVFVPLNPGYTRAELTYLLEDAAPRVFVTDPARTSELAPLADSLGITLRTLDVHERGSLADAAAAQPSTPRHAQADASRVAAILYTSGTTGRSKGAMLTLANLEFGARALARAWRFSEADVLLHALPIFHVHGLFIALGSVLASGSAMRFLTRFQEHEVIDAFPTCSVFMGVPTHYVRLLNAAIPRERIAHVRLFVSGSAPLLPDTFRAWTARTGHVILERYGMTETSVIASNPYDGPRREGMVGHALEGTELRVVDPETLAPTPPGRIGSVQVRGPHVFAGYWQKPDKTRESLSADGFFVTGDLGQLEPDGCLQLIGRGNDLIITGGLNVYPKEVETCIDALPGVLESAVVGLPHADFGEAVTAFVVRGDETLDPAHVLAALGDRLAKFKQPKQIVFLAELPRNTMGKVLKAELRRAHADRYREQ